MIWAFAFVFVFGKQKNEERKKDVRSLTHSGQVIRAFLAQI
jgi:hypothetical protein